MYMKWSASAIEKASGARVDLLHAPDQPPDRHGRQHSASVSASYSRCQDVRWGCYLT